MKVFCVTVRKLFNSFLDLLGHLFWMLIKFLLDASPMREGGRGLDGGGGRNHM